MTNRLVVCVVTCAACVGIAGIPTSAATQTLTAQTNTTTWSPVSPSAGPSAFKSLFQDTLRDFSRVPSRETVTLLSLGAAGAAVGHRFDAAISRGVSGSSGANTTLALGESMGGARMQLAGAIATYAVGRITTSPRVAAIGADLIRAQIVTQTLTVAVKAAVGRTRPDGTEYSFPSGHSSVTFATATVLQRNLGWKVGVPAYTVASYVAASRIQDRRHFLSDVVFGATLGIAAGRAVTFGRGNHRFALAPTAVPGGGGISVSWVHLR